MIDLVDCVHAVANVAHLIERAGQRDVACHQPVFDHQDHLAVLHSFEMTDPRVATRPVWLHAVENGSKDNVIKQIQHHDVTDVGQVPRESVRSTQQVKIDADEPSSDDGWVASRTQGSLNGGVGE